MGPLTGIRVVEMAGIGPGPFTAMMLSDLGAEVIRVDRLSHKGTGHRANVLNRGRKSIAVDLKNPRGVETTLRLILRYDSPDSLKKVIIRTFYGRDYEGFKDLELYHGDEILFGRQSLDESGDIRHDACIRLRMPKMTDMNNYDFFVEPVD